MLTEYVWTQEESLEAVIDCIDSYMAIQPPFTKRYGYDDLQSDILVSCNNDVELSKVMVLEALDIASYPFVKIPTELELPMARKNGKARDGIWTSLRKMGAAGRNKLALSGERFYILQNRKVVGAYKRSKSWERSVSAVWQLAIECESSGVWLLTMASNPIRDNQMEWMRINQDNGRWRLKWKTSRAGNEFMALERV